MRVLLVIAMTLFLSGCGVLSAAQYRQAMETSTIPAFSGMFVIQHGAISLFSICPFRWCLIRYCCRLTPAMAPITN